MPRLQPRPNRRGGMWVLRDRVRAAPIDLLETARRRWGPAWYEPRESGAIPAASGRQSPRSGLRRRREAARGDPLPPTRAVALDAGRAGLKTCPYERLLVGPPRGGPHDDQGRLKPAPTYESGGRRCL